MAQAAYHSNDEDIGCTLYPFYCYAVSPTYPIWCPLQASDIFALKKHQQFEGRDIQSYNKRFTSIIHGSLLIICFIGQNIYHHKNHPIRYVRLTGVIVDINEYNSFSVNGKGRWIGTLDDGSGYNVELVCEIPPRPSLIVDLDSGRNISLDRTTRGIVTQIREESSFVSADGPDLTGIVVGSVVKVKGGITEFRGIRQIQLKKIWDLRKTRECDLNKNKKIGDQRNTNEETRCWNEVAEFRQNVLSSPWSLSAEEIVQCEEDEKESVLDEHRRAAKEKKRAGRSKKHEDRAIMKKKQQELREKQKPKTENSRVQKVTGTKENILFKSTSSLAPSSLEANAEKRLNLRTQILSKEKQYRRDVIFGTQHTRIKQLMESATCKETVGTKPNQPTILQDVGQQDDRIFLAERGAMLRAKLHETVFTTASMEHKRMREEALLVHGDLKTVHLPRHKSGQLHNLNRKDLPLQLGMLT